MHRKHLIGLDSKSYEHPLDRKVLNALKGKIGFEAATNAFLNWSYIKWYIISLKGGYFEVTQESIPELYNEVLDVAKTLDVNRVPDIYTQWDYAINGHTTGYSDNTLMVLTSGSVDLLTEEELRFVVGHEMGHIKSGHVLYHTMANLMNVAASQLPLFGTLALGVQYLLLYWNRISEFTADRAGLLACQDIDVALRSIIKMAGLPLKYYDKPTRDAFIKQAESFHIDLNDFSDKAIKTITIATSTHPWTVLRAQELLKWYNSGEYEKILNSTSNDVCIFPDCAMPIKKGATVCPHCGRPQSF